jgi:hypothetical protein
MKTENGRTIKKEKIYEHQNKERDHNLDFK